MKKHRLYDQFVKYTPLNIEYKAVEVSSTSSRLAPAAEHRWHVNTSAIKIRLNKDVTLTLVTPPAFIFNSRLLKHNISCMSVYIYIANLT